MGPLTFVLDIQLFLFADTEYFNKNNCCMWELHTDMFRTIHGNKNDEVSEQSTVFLI
jgi:hypothetical protein